jgi:hypothetical protein
VCILQSALKVFLVLINVIFAKGFSGFIIILNSARSFKMDVRYYSCNEHFVKFFFVVLKVC